MILLDDAMQKSEPIYRLVGTISDIDKTQEPNSSSILPERMYTVYTLLLAVVRRVTSQTNLADEERERAWSLPLDARPNHEALEWLDLVWARERKLLDKHDY
jgi:hypothetical protein